MARKPEPPKPPESARELIVMVRPDAGMRASRSRVESVTGQKTTSIRDILKDNKAVMMPLFGPNEERVITRTRSEAETAEMPLEDLSVFYRVEADEERLDEIGGKLFEQELVEAAYVKPASSPPVGPPEDGTAAPDTPDAAPPLTANFEARQGYLDAPPTGVNARWAWTRTNGTGDGVRIVDIEGAWRFTHEDLVTAQAGVVGGIQFNDLGWRNHGTAVLGEFSGDPNPFGITGIAPDAIAMAVAIGGIGTSAAINAGAARLSAGDVMLIELHRPGPQFNFEGRGDQRGYIAIEWWPDDYAALLNATRRGILVVEAAGNGAENLDDDIYENRPAGFPATWRNPFRRVNRDSGCIVVGAGAPPPGTHGRDHGPDRSRLDFSNYGDIIDCQGWGREVTTCGYGDLQGGPDEDLWYTDRFSGTSSASPIIVGTVAGVVGMAVDYGRPVPTPAQMRNALRTTGSPQQDAPGRPVTQRIGTRPDMEALAKAVYGSKSFLKDLADKSREMPVAEKTKKKGKASKKKKKKAKV
ncbi:MAG: S8 family serine peptidase [Rhodobiaceae bacterium]|nr:S8 family serine peptidase [Rhodobiaceae bacterium]